MIGNSTAGIEFAVFGWTGNTFIAKTESYQTPAD
jgi:hypothetical protein